MITTVCLIGSARFADTFHLVEEQLTTMGLLVLSKDPRALARRKAEGEFDPVDLELFHLVHLAKVERADVVLVIDGEPTFELGTSHDPYIGESTAREILWARLQDKPVLSLMSVSGWGNLAETINQRYDINFLEQHAWLVEHARRVLGVNAGVATVKELIGETAVDALEGADVLEFRRQHSVMHAMLSIIASNHGTLATMAEVGLREVGLDPMDDVETALAGVVAIPPEPTILRNSRLLSADNDEPMTSLPTRKLVGTLIMVQAVIDMGLDDRIGKRRREMVAKLELMRETLLDSFGVTQTEVDRAREGNGGMDFPIAQH